MVWVLGDRMVPVNWISPAVGEAVMIDAWRASRAQCLACRALV